jgi:Bacterial conjugation TrbI-like protein
VPKMAVAISTPDTATVQTNQEMDRLKAEVALSDQRQMLERLRTPVPKAAVPQKLPPIRTAPVRRPTLPRPTTDLPEASVNLPVAPRPTSKLPEILPRPITVALSRSTPVSKFTSLMDERPTNSRITNLGEERPVRSGTTSLDPDLEAGTGAITAGLPLSLSANRKKVIPATTLAIGVLERPILVEQGERSGAVGESERYLVVLTEAVADADGEVLLAEGTRVLVTIQRISANGFVTMKAVALQQQGREVSLLSTSVRGQGGLPLQANGKDKGSEIANLDLGQSLLKGAEDGMSILNRATSSTQSSGAGGSFSTSSYGAVNGLAAIGSGFFGELGRSIRQRNQLAVKQIQERPNLWLIPGGTPVELLFGREIAL